MALSLPESRKESQKRENDQPSVWPNWNQQTVVCMASGPSLTAEDIALVENQRKFGAQTIRTIAINDCGLARHLPMSAPWADILYAADARWWQHHRPSFTGLRVSGEKVLPVKNPRDGRTTEVETQVLKMLTTGRAPMPYEPGSVVHGNHSGFQALGLALTLGAARIFLLGYDCGKIGGQAWAHPDRDAGFKRQSPYDKWAEPYNQVPGRWPYVEIINCSAHSVITVFPKRPLGEVI
jgi:hypothetical protein